MILWNALVLAIQQIVRNVRRSALTTLGVLIGVAAVIAMVTLGRSATEAVNEDLSGLGSNLLFVIPGAEGPGGGNTAEPLTQRDADRIRSEIPGLRAVSASTSFPTVASAGEEHWRTTVTGADVEYLEVMDWDVVDGRPYTEGELRSGAAVAILGQTIVDELFGAQDPIDEEIRLGTVSFTVIGVLDERGQNTFGMDMDDFIQIPLTTYHRRIAGNTDISFISISVTDPDDTPRIKEDLDRIMRSQRGVRPEDEPDFMIQDMAEVQEMIGSITGVLTSLLAAIAAISLLVGGIGIMNIMLVSVTERTREIGVRLAVGARSRDVLLQFLVEAVVLSTLGGIAGIVLGVAGVRAAVTRLDLPFVLDVDIILLAFGFSALVGVVFGYFPARRASRLNPIDALRHE